ncbi:NB-ARC domain-containing protein, partial [Sphaerisporangium sp. B11E5]|uniref:NB-ARC domain-containing protein n=1 Tax=Sphaerisporangium sp. B11E5 TaxID=3153563 RepID=UPI00325CE729
MMAEAVVSATAVKVDSPVRRLQAPRAARFVGRAETLERLEGLLAGDADQVVVRQVVHGMGGVGKSELVRQFAHAHRDRYPVAWWITAEQPEDIKQEFAKLAAALHPPVGQLGDVDQAAQWALTWLQAHPGWLVVLDNVNDPADVRQWLDWLTGGHVLITTRRQVYWPGTASIAVDVLDEKSAAELIVSVSGRGDPDDRESVQAIAEELGRLPLALEQAAAYIRQEDLDPRQYLELLRRTPARMGCVHGGGVRVSAGSQRGVVKRGRPSRDPFRCSTIEGEPRRWP